MNIEKFFEICTLVAQCSAIASIAEIEEAVLCVMQHSGGNKYTLAIIANGILKKRRERRLARLQIPAAWKTRWELLSESCQQKAAGQVDMDMTGWRTLYRLLRPQQ